MAYKQKTIDRTIVGQPTKWDTYQRSGGTYVFLASGSGTGRTLVFDKVTRSWYTTPGWKTLLRTQGWLPTQSMTELRQYVNQTGIGTFQYFCYGGQYRVDMKTVDPLYVPDAAGLIGFNPAFLTSSEKGSLKEDARYKCLDKVRDMKVNLAVMYGERRQTVKMLTDTCNTLGRAYRAFRRGRFRQAAKELGIDTPTKTLANHWLAYQYGWRPLLSDAKGLISIAETGPRDTAEGVRMRVRASATRTSTYQLVYDGQGASNLPGGNTKLDGTLVAKASAGLLVEFKPGQAGGASLGLGVYDPLLTAWELTPFSFVFDWFVDVGSYLESLSTLAEVSVLTGFASVSETSFGKATMHSPQTAGWVVGKKPSCDFTWHNYSREPWSGTVTLRKPLFDGLNARRLVTSAALWRQRTQGDRNGSYRP